MLFHREQCTESSFVSEFVQNQPTGCVNYQQPIHPVQEMQIANNQSKVCQLEHNGGGEVKERPMGHCCREWHVPFHQTLQWKHATQQQLQFCVGGVYVIRSAFLIAASSSCCCCPSHLIPLGGLLLLRLTTSNQHLHVSCVQKLTTHRFWRRNKKN